MGTPNLFFFQTQEKMADTVSEQAAAAAAAPAPAPAPASAQSTPAPVNAKEGKSPAEQGGVEGSRWACALG